MRKLLLLVGVLLAAAVGGIFAIKSWLGPARSGRASLASAKMAFEARQYDDALAICQQLLQHRPDSSNLLILAGESATKLSDFDAALAYYARVPESSASEAATAKWASGEIQYHLGQASEAIELLEDSLRLNPKLSAAHQRLASLFNTFGQRRDALPHLTAVLKTGQVQPVDLMLIGNLARTLHSSGEIDRYLKSDPQDLLPTLGHIVSWVSDLELEEASAALDALLAQRPKLVEAHVQRGICLEKQEPSGLASWNAALPSAAASHPDIWFLRGQMTRAHDPEGAVRCLAEAIVIDPNHLKAHTAMATLLNQLGRSETAVEFANRAGKLQRINIALDQIFVAPTFPDPMKEVAELTLELGRVWEAISWCGYAASLDSSLAWPRAIMTQIQQDAALTTDMPLTLPSGNLAIVHNLRGDYDLPDFSSDSLSAQPMGSIAGNSNGATAGAPTTTGESAVRFEDIAEQAGLNFTFQNNHNATSSVDPKPGRLIFETTGGGVAALDADGDGWQDLFCVQAGRYPASENNPSDQLFRNLRDGSGNRRLEDITTLARISEHAFGQGVTVGDVNADGFDDLYVCNIGPNQLWLNNGDGTFMRSDWLLPQVDRWTSSAAVVDLDGDGLTEIYEANYVDDPQAFTRMCQVAGLPRSCSPLVFSSGTDRILSPSASGRFEAVSDIARDDLAANSLGVLAFRMAGEARPHLFVSVDQQANLLLRTEPNEQSLHIENEALLLGAAYDEGGRAQACMGIAAGDANQDGEIDLYVTNFYLEYNTLYLQKSGLFVDATAGSSTVRDTRLLLGFGTQWLDAQLDGFADLVVLNGHIDDHSHIDVAEEMPTQVFAGSGTGKFTRLEPSEAGDFFARPRLGRALAKWDFDRDGLSDLVCADLEKPVALLHNQSLPQGDSCSLRLVGTKSSRRAECAIAILTGADYRQQLQLIAGGGYQASNENALQFTIPTGLQSATLEVHWPSGAVESWDLPQPAGFFTAVESQGVYR